MSQERLDKLLVQARKDENFQAILDHLAGETIGPANVSGLADTAKALIALLVQETDQKPLVYIVPDVLRARTLLQDLQAFRGKPVPFLNKKPSDLLARGTKSRGEEIELLNFLTSLLLKEDNFYVVTASALIDTLPAIEYFRQNLFQIKVGDDYDLGDLAKKLESLGYLNVSMVDAQGQFSVRGEIIDIGINGGRFDYSAESIGIRLHFFDTELESIRIFDLESQRSLEDIGELSLGPLHERLLTATDRQKLAGQMRVLLDETISRLRRDSVQESAIDHLTKWVKQDIEAMEEGMDFAGMSRWDFLINPDQASILDYARVAGARLVIEEPKLSRERLDASYAEQIQEYKTLLEKNSILAEQTETGINPAQAFAGIHTYPKSVLVLANLASSGNGLPGGDKYSIQTLDADNYQGREKMLFPELKSWQKQGKEIVLAVSNERQQKRLRELLLEESLTFPLYEMDLNQGLIWPKADLVILGSKNLFGRIRRAKRRKRRDGEAINFFGDLKVGEYVVHDIHGIGQYLGLTSLKTGSSEREYLHIQYSAEDSLYIPVDQLDEIQRYIGGEGKKPKLSKLGSNEWERRKERVRASVKKLAVDLVAIYSKRSQQKGHTFSPDTVWQQEFEDAFPFVETDDQLQAIEEIKADMESDKIMDRLLIGDVGFGKTELAFRAMYKAVMDNKQVAMVVPTTVLAQQHYQSFMERIGDFPVRTRLMSRYVTENQRKQTIKDLKSGQVDVVIGTHSVLNKNIKFKDLGLLVIDEEQRFGVDHKESIKERYPNVDVLTLSATPIPRTLHMAVSGVRDISSLAEGPEDRRPVQTYVMEYDSDIIDEAILREISREGQVFYILNDIRRLPAKQKELEERLEGVEIRIAHGRLSERVMEETIRDFQAGEFDVLLSTTIVESGIDMPRVNTLIVERSERMGLAQLYQLRGRVGRSERQAYAYITFPPDQIINEDAQKRLAAIRDFTELGSGLNIAMRDLEVRGAGNFLGGEQSGHMGEVGYDLYTRLLEESIREVQGMEPKEKAPSTIIDLDIDAIIPQAYIHEEGQRMDIYKRILAIQDKDDRYDVIDELRDRYGEPPRPVMNLLDIAFVRAIAGRAGIERISQQGKDIVLKISEDAKHSPEIMQVFQNESLAGKVRFNAGYNPYLQIAGGANRPDYMAELLASLWL